MRSPRQIEAEILAIESRCDPSKYDTEDEDHETVLAVGAHDALRWALGLAEQPISEALEGE